MKKTIYDEICAKMVPDDLITKVTKSVSPVMNIDLLIALST